MATVQDLNDAFSQSCVKDLNKEIGKLLGTADKKVKNFNAFLQKKQYKKIDPEADDRARYTAMMEAIVNFASTDGSLDSMLRDKDAYFRGVTALLISNGAFDIFSENFNKGSFKALSAQLNRFFNPKKDEDTLEDVETLNDYVKPYAKNFSDLLHNANGLHLYCNLTLSSDKIEQSAMDLILAGVSVFSICTTDDNCKSLWVTDTEIDGKSGGFISTNADDFMTNIDNETFELNPIHCVGLDTVKRDFKNGKYDLFVSHSTVLSKSTNLRCYRADYKRSSDFNDISEERMWNAVNGIAQSYEPLKKKVFASFVFNGEVGNVSVVTYWLTTDSISKVMEADDVEVFDWNEITIHELVDHMKETGTLGQASVH